MSAVSFEERLLVRLSEEERSVLSYYVLNEDRTGVACVLGNAGSQRVFFNGRQGNIYSDIKSLQFSVDGSHLAYEAFEGEKFQGV